MALLTGIVTFIGMATFVGIVGWAFSRGRANANQQASFLPFALPDEGVTAEQIGESHE